jgi:hypothetical protein
MSDPWAIDAGVNWSELVGRPTVEIFGDRVLYKNKRQTWEIQGVFDQAYLELTPMGRGGDDTESAVYGSQGAISDLRPVLGVQLDAFRGGYPEQGDVLEILSGTHRGERFEVKEVRDDSHGHALLTLNEYAG